MTRVITFVSGGIRASTIDLMLAMPRLTSELAKCLTWEYEYGSDRRVIRTSFWMNMDRREGQERMLFKSAPWGKIREAVERGKEAGLLDEDVDEMASRLTSWVNRAVEAHCPRARPSLYMKRLWNEGLTALRNP